MKPSDELLLVLARVVQRRLNLRLDGSELRFANREDQEDWLEIEAARRMVAGERPQEFEEIGDGRIAPRA
jgi:hypothetical protein